MDTEDTSADTWEVRWPVTDLSFNESNQLQAEGGHLVCNYSRLVCCSKLLSHFLGC